MTSSARHPSLLDRRAAGLLLHPTSLPSPHGIGDLGPAAHRFVHFLAAAGQRIWQVLPLGPTGYDGSPYRSPSSHAGNPWLIDLSALAAEGWLTPAEIEPLRSLPADHVDYRRVGAVKQTLLGRAAERFLARRRARGRVAFEEFCHRQRRWLDDYAAFAVLAQRRRGRRWASWGTARPDPRGMDVFRFAQWTFFRQWEALRRHCRERNVVLLGDLPIFVAYESADVWRRPDLFDLDSRGRPRHVAGCPPDYYSARGQLWGNPLYRWSAHRSEGFAWWLDRLRSALSLVDVVRLDHFRGFAAFWEVPAGARDARSGRWRRAPGAELLEAARRSLGGLPFVAEDLGLITPDVEALRDRFGLPGMRLLQFAFGETDASHPFRPHNFVPNCVAYTGTHDNDTISGWLRGRGGVGQAPGAVRAERARALAYVGSDGREPHWGFVRAVLASVARTAIVPVQDVLGLGSAARMNRPGRPSGNWRWRLLPGQLTRAHAARLAQMSALYGR